MRLKFWGVRGSVPVPEIDKMKIGGNTSCLELMVDDDRRIIFDAGSGIRGLGRKIAGEISAGKQEEILLFLSHTHWDHIQGLVFFTPLFIQGTRMRIIGPARANRTLEHLVSGQMEYDYWPVKLSQLPANIVFEEWKEGTYRVLGDVEIVCKRHIHPGGAMGYRINYGGKSFVYSTDTEHFKNQMDKRVIELAKDADVMVHDAQYKDEEMDFKLGWGHSSWQQAVQTANEAGVKKLVLFHHDPVRSDDQCEEIERLAQAQRPDAVLAREGMELEI